MSRLLIVNKSLALSMSIMLTLVTLLSIARSAVAEESRVAPGRNVPTALSQQGPTDRVELEAFLDDLLGKETEEYHIAGAAVSIVKDGDCSLPRATAMPTWRTASLSIPSRRSFALVPPPSWSPGQR